jgi:heterodisulfide reductase subunit A
MIQCVGSRNDEHPYCSRICCARAVKNAVAVKQRWPGTEVHILNRDIRTYGFRESLYRQARELGVHFVRFEPDREPTVTVDDGLLQVRFLEANLGADVTLATDMVVLSTGVAPDADANDELGKLFKVPVNQDGFFLEAHAKLRPVEFATEGVYLAGLAHGPKSLDEAMAQALAAASRACTVLEKENIATQATIAEVRPERCVSCGLCESVCAYGAVSLEEQQIGRETRVFAKVNPALCKGCGACVAGCRSGALNLRGFTDQQILAEILEL